LFGTDPVLEEGTQESTGYEDFWVSHEGEVCIEEDGSQRCLEQTQVISYWGGEDQVDMPSDVDVQSFALGEVRSGDTIETTLIEMIDRGWSSDQLEQSQPPQIDLDYPVSEPGGNGYGEYQNVEGSEVTVNGSVMGAAEFASRREHQPPSQRQMFERALYQRALGAGSAQHQGGDEAVSSAVDSSCFEINWEHSSYDLSYVWDPEHNNGAGGWRSGSFTWSADNVFEVGKYWGMDYQEKGDTFYAWVSSGTFDACLYPITLKAKEVSSAVRQVWELEHSNNQQED
jgi:hypothetical protein